MHDSWIAILNPVAAGGKTKAVLPTIREAFERASLKYSILETERPGQGPELVRDAMASGARQFISIGGDGTHHEVVNGIMSVHAKDDPCTLGIIPVGTGNDWARTLNVPRDIQGAVEILQDGHTRLHTAGKIEFTDEGKPATRFFVNAAGMCLDAIVVRDLTRQNLVRFGTVAYFFAGIRGVLTFKPQRVRLKTGEEQTDERFFTVNLGIGRFSGGGMSFTPHADPFNGKLALTTVRKTNRFWLLANMSRAYTGSIAKFGATTCSSVRDLKVEHEADDAIAIEADGEFVGYSPAQFSCIPKAFRVCVPADVY